MLDNQLPDALPMPMPQQPSQAAMATEGDMQPLQPALPPRLGGFRLVQMYNAWEQAKTGENLAQHEASRYYHGKQWTDAELRILKKRKQPPTVKNRIKRKVDFLVGVEQRMRRDPKGFPRNPSADRASGVATSCLRYVQDVTKWPANASEAAHDALIRGIGVLWQGIEIVKGRPEVKKYRVPADRFLYDPRAERHDFSDARFVGEWQWMDIEQAKELLPWASEAIDNVATSANSGGLGMGALPQEFEKEQNWVDTRNRRLRLISIWYRHEGNWMFDYIVGPVSLCPDDMNCLSPYLDEDGKTTHPYTAWSPYVDESGDRYGVVRDMIPIQDEINKRSSKVLHLLTVRQTLGKKGAVDDVDAMKRELAKPDGHVEINPGFEKDFQILNQADQIRGQLELLQEDKAEIENLGPNPGLIGRGVEKQSGRAILAQQNSGMTELSPVFERMREWKLRSYNKDWALIRQFWTDERYVRVTANPQAIEFLTVNKVVTDPMTGMTTVENSIADIDVDIILEEGPDTITMREELLEALSDRPDIPVEILIELSTIPEKETVLEKLAKFKAPPPDVQEMQKRMAQLEEAMAAAKVDKQQADTEKTRADTAKVMVETMMPPEAFPQIFPLHYGQSFLDQAIGMMGAPPPGMAQNALAGPPGAPPDMPMQPPPPNAMAGGEPMMPQGVEQEDYLSQMAPYPDPREYTEPQLGERGGLPMGPM